MKNKKCNKCNKIKQLNDFHKSRNYCIKCKKLQDKEYYNNNKNRLKNNRIKYYEKNKEHQLSKCKEYYEKNKEYISTINKEYYEKNKEKLDSYRKNYWKQKVNKDRRNRKLKEKRKNNINFRLKCNIRTRISTALKRGDKRVSAVKDLGCSIDELKDYLESLFQPGMTWNNYGQWHIDHIIPLSSFNLQNEEEFKKACHFSNLQPLWAVDNIRKRDSIS